MPAANTYSRSLVLLYLNGTQIDGFAEGDFLTISQPEDGVTFTRDVNGGGTFNHRVIDDAVATLTLHGGSSANDILQELLTLQRETASTVITFALQDPLATSKRSSSPACKIVKRPDMVFGDEIGTVEWSLILSNATINHSGRIPLA